MKTLFLFSNQNLLLDASAILQNPVLIFIIGAAALFITFKVAFSMGAFHESLETFKGFKGSRQRASAPIKAATAKSRPRKKGKPGFSLSVIVIAVLFVFAYYQQPDSNNSQALQTGYNEASNQPYSLGQTVSNTDNEVYVNQSPKQAQREKNLDEHTYRPDQDFIPPSSETYHAPATEKDYTALSTSAPSPATTPAVAGTPMYTIQVKSASDHHYVRAKAYDYSQDFPRTDVYTYQQGSVTKIFVGQYYSEQEMRSALRRIKNTISSGAFPVAINSIDAQALESTY